MIDMANSQQTRIQLFDEEQQSKEVAMLLDNSSQQQRHRKADAHLENEKFLLATIAFLLHSVFIFL